MGSLHFIWNRPQNLTDHVSALITQDLENSRVMGSLHFIWSRPQIHMVSRIHAWDSLKNRGFWFGTTNKTTDVTMDTFVLFCTELQWRTGADALHIVHSSTVNTTNFRSGCPSLELKITDPLLGKDCWLVHRTDFTSHSGAIPASINALSYRQRDEIPWSIRFYSRLNISYFSANANWMKRNRNKNAFQ